MLYALYGEHARDLLTLNGRPIVHDNREEMQWLLPDARVVPVNEHDLRRRSPLPPLPLNRHPDLEGIRWPLDRSQFR